jgi:hypothetical protein
MNEAPEDDPLNGSKDRVPAGSQDYRRLPPTESTRPVGQKDSVTVRASVFTVGPGNLFDGA